MDFDFEHYLKAGHGRAYLMAREDPGKYRDDILIACCRDFTFDMQCEGSRAFLVADLICLFDDPEPFIAEATESFNLSEVDDDPDDIQYLSDLLMLFGERDTVKDKYKKLWSKLFETPYIFLSDLSNKLLFNVQYLAIKLTENQPWDITDEIIEDLGYWYLKMEDEGVESEFNWLYSTLEDQYGELETASHLKELAKTSKEVSAFVEKDLRFYQDLGKRFTRRRNTLTASDVVARLVEEDTLNERALLSMGVRNMEDSELLKLAEEASLTEDLVLRSKIVSVYKTRRYVWPLDPKILIGWAEEGNGDLTAECRGALSELKAEGIREYALSVLEKGFDSDALCMLIRNRQPSDEEYILSILESIPIEADENEGDWHGTGSVILDCAEEGEVPLSFLMWIYNSTLCSCCRESVVDRLIKLNKFTDDIIKECLWDANLDIRCHAQKQSLGYE